MYSKIKLCVKTTFVNETRTSKDIDAQTNENFTNQNENDYFFTSKVGVFQGESLSPFLFSMYINDLSEHLEADGIGIDIDHNIMLTSLLFADDMVILSKTREGLQKGLDSLQRYCNLWGLSVNKNKTKCVAFKKGGIIGEKGCLVLCWRSEFVQISRFCVR